MDEELVRLVDALEVEHQKVKRAYLAWCPGQDCPARNGVGAENNGMTTTFFQANPTVLRPINKIRNQIISASVGLDPKQKYDLMREVYYAHPSFHEVWWIEGHFEHDLTRSILHSRRFALNKLMNVIDKGSSTQLAKHTTFITRYALLLENLLSSRLTVSLLDVPADEQALRSNVREGIDSWETLSIAETPTEMPVLFSIVHTLLKKTKYWGIEPRNLLETKRWHLEWAQCSVNEGPIFKKETNLSRVEIFRCLPSITDQEAIRSYLQEHYTVSSEEYDRVRGGEPMSRPIEEESVLPMAPVLSMNSQQARASGKMPRPDITGRIERWRDSRGLLRFPDQGLTNGGRQYVAFRYGPDRKKQHDLVAIRNDTTVTLELNKKLAEKPPFTTREARLEMVSRLNGALGLSIPEEMAERKPSFSIANLDPPEKFAAFMEVLDWVMAEIRRNEPDR